MAAGGPEANKALPEKSSTFSGKLWPKKSNPDVTKVPQLWCLYKEVQDFYNAGMRAPDDVTLLWAEDNWGNVRRLPTAEERKRSGGAGIYYHFDYHGGPRSYQWINTSPISKIWDQMSLAKQYGADRIWIVNVGHFKGYEFPLEYFMDLAWDTNRWTSNNLDEFTRLWAAREFGPAHAADIADIIAKYTKYNGRRKPELLEPDTYSPVNYREAENVVTDFKTITAKAEELYGKLPEAKRDAFYELVLFPTKASALVNELYLAAGRNALFARQGRAPRSLERASEGCLVNSEFIAHVCAKPVVCAELFRDFQREVFVQAAFHIDQSQLLQFGFRLGRQLVRFKPDVRLLCVALGADRHIFAHGHGHRAGDQSRHACDEDSSLRCRGCRDTDHEARGRNNGIVRSEHSGAQPSGTPTPVPFRLARINNWFHLHSPTSRFALSRAGSVCKNLMLRLII